MEFYLLKHLPQRASQILSNCQNLSAKSHDNRTKVGVIITDPNLHMLVAETNRNAQGCSPERASPEAKHSGMSGLMHAEVAAHITLIRKFPEIVRNPMGLVLFSTHAPCLACANTILEFGLIKCVIYRQAYVMRSGQPDTAGIELLKKRGIVVRHLQAKSSSKLRKKR